MVIGTAVCTVPLSKRVFLLQCRFMTAIEALEAAAQERSHDDGDDMCKVGNEVQWKAKKATWQQMVK